MTRERLREVRRKHDAVAETSESNIDCVRLTHLMKAQLIPYRMDDFVIDRHQADDVRELSSNRDTTWGWDITARHKGELGLLLELSCAISREDQEFRHIRASPIFDGAIKVAPSQDDSSQQASTEQPWWRRIFGGFFERISGLFGG